MPVFRKIARVFKESGACCDSIESQQGLIAARPVAQFLWGEAEMAPERARELSVVAEAEAVGDFGDRQTIGGITELGVTGVQTLVADPLADCLVGVAKELMQITRGDAA